jgi:hypothetical protein
MGKGRKQSTAASTVETAPAPAPTVTDTQVTHIAQALLEKAYPHGYGEKEADTYYKAISISLGNAGDLEAALSGIRKGGRFSETHPAVAEKQECELTAEDATSVFNFHQSVHEKDSVLGVVVNGKPTIFGKSHVEIKELEHGQPRVVWIKVEHKDVVEIVDDSKLDDSLESSSDNKAAGNVKLKDNDKSDCANKPEEPNGANKQNDVNKPTDDKPTTDNKQTTDNDEPANNEKSDDNDKIAAPH